jgi:hypothetical protein
MKTLLATMITIIIGACGPSGSGMGGGGDDDGDGSSGGSDGAPPLTCTNASDCGGGQVCNPDGNHCASDVPCSTADQCGNGGVCNGTSCEPNTTGGNCVGDESCLAGETCTDGHCGCDGVRFQAEPIVPNLMIVLDRSDSMNDPGGGGDSKWTIAKAALNQILDDHGPSVNFGLDMFASNNSCAAGNVNVDVGAGTSSTISNTIQSSNAASGTPIRATMSALRNYSGLKDHNHPNYVLLITDGEESCDIWNDPSTPVQQLRQQTPTVKTFVVGFGSGVSASQLNDMATKGGTARPGSPKYYQANDATQLSNALDAILGTVLSCTYTLDQVPEDLSELYVYQDDAPIGQDTTHANGWDYDEQTGELTFYGAACDALESGGVTDLAIVYGCPNPDVE